MKMWNLDVRKRSRFIALSGACAVAMMAVKLTAADDKKPAGESKVAGKTTEVKAGDLTLQIPDRWKARKSTSSMRVAEYEVPPAKDDKEPGEFVIFFFGPGGAGGLEPNIQRWTGQFEEKERKVRILKGKSDLGDYTLVDITGTYNKSIGPPIQKKSKRLENWRVINVFLETDKGPYFLKFDAPTKTVAAAEAEFRKTFGGDAKSEKEEKPKE
jgi:hypothetical protein